MVEILGLADSFQSAAPLDRPAQYEPGALSIMIDSSSQTRHQTPMESADLSPTSISRRLYVFAIAILYVLVIAKALSYWVYAFHKDPSSPLSVTAIYRNPDDIEYYILINALSHGNFSESVLAERGSRMNSYPLAALAVHALCYRFFGVPGIIVADVIVYLMFFRLLAAFFGLLGADRLISYASAALLSTGALSWITGLLSGYEVIGQQFQMELWGTRIPRPFVTELFFFACLCCSFKLLTREFATQINLWVLTGTALSLLLQGDIYLGFTVLLSILLLAAYLLVTNSAQRQQIIRGLFYFTITSAICLVPFLLQRLLENPDASVRMGLFHVSRLTTFHIGLLPFTPLLIVLVGGTLLAFLQSTLCPHDQAARNTRIIGFMTMLSIFAYFALHINCLLLGRAVQVDHFRYTFINVSRYTILTIAFIGIGIILRLLRIRLQSMIHGATLTRHFNEAISLATVVLITVFLASARPSYATDRIGKNLQGYPELRTNYRPAFAELVRELSRNEYNARPVLATFDQQVSTWWNAFRQGYLFTPASATTTTSDAAIEYRLSAFCKLVGMKEESHFSRFVNTPNINAIWLGHNKYHVTRLHTFSPLDKYPVNIHKELSSLSWFASWNLFIPSDEISRLEKVFLDSTIEPQALDLDVIVLTAYETAQGLEPTPQLFLPIYHNDIFRVWVRKLPSAPTQTQSPI